MHARRLYAAALVAAPLAMGVAALVDPTPEADSTAALLDLVAERPGAWSAGLLLFFLSGLLWVPAGLGLLRVLLRGQLLGRIAALAVLVGGAALVPLDAASLYLAELAGSSVPLAQQVAVVEGVEGSLALVLAEVVHVVGLFAGLLLLAIAVFRARITPVWVPVVLVVALAGLLAAPHRAVQAVALVLLVAAFAGLAVRLTGAGAADRSDEATAVRAGA
ncbi:hypothetical protein [Blastococcus sp. SYSU DS0617]